MQNSRQASVAEIASFQTTLEDLLRNLGSELVGECMGIGASKIDRWRKGLEAPDKDDRTMLDFLNLLMKWVSQNSVDIDLNPFELMREFLTYSDRDLCKGRFILPRPVTNVLEEFLLFELPDFEITEERVTALKGLIADIVPAFNRFLEQREVSAQHIG